MMRHVHENPDKRHRFDYDAAHMIWKRHRSYIYLPTYLPKKPKDRCAGFVFGLMDAYGRRAHGSYLKMCIFPLRNKLVGGKITCAEQH